MILPISLTSLHCWYSIIDIDGNMLVNFEDLDGCKLLTNAMLENDHLTSDFFGESSYPDRSIHPSGSLWSESIFLQSEHKLNLLWTTSICH